MNNIVTGNSNFAHRESVKWRNLGMNHPTAMISRVNATTAIKAPQRIEIARGE
jgi:hypothetical protein